MDASPSPQDNSPAPSTRRAPQPRSGTKAASKPGRHGPSDTPQPLGGYAALLGTYAAVFGGLLGLVRLTGRRLPERPSPVDLLLLGTATHKISRTLARDSVLSVVRAPFVTYSGRAGMGEVEEDPRGQGLRLAVGELLTCPYCLAVWVATPLAFGLTLAPRLTRHVAGLFAVVTISDCLQRLYVAIREKI